MSTVKIAVLLPDGPGAHEAWEAWLDRQCTFEARMVARTAHGEAPSGVEWYAWGIVRPEQLAGREFNEIVVTNSHGGVALETIQQARFYLR